MHSIIKTGDSWEWTECFAGYIPAQGYTVKCYLKLGSNNPNVIVGVAEGEDSNLRRLPLIPLFSLGEYTFFCQITKDIYLFVSKVPEDPFNIKITSFSMLSAL